MVEIVQGNREGVLAAAKVVKKGGLVAFPTESWYGLAVNPWNEAGLQKLYRVKKRPWAKATLVLINKMEQLDSLVSEVPKPYYPVIDKFWPGALTLVFPALSSLPSLITAGTGTVAVRFSSHPMVSMLVEQVGPITGTSANISGYGPHKNASMVVQELGDELDLLIDGGDTAGGESSTIVACDGDNLVCLRHGLVDFSLVLASNG